MTFFDKESRVLKAMETLGVGFAPVPQEAVIKAGMAATPNGMAMQHARALMQADVKLIDLAADFRLQDPALWEQWYGMPHACPELLAEAVYGLPEVNRDKIKMHAS